MRIPISALVPIKNGEQWLTGFATYIRSELNSKDEIILIDDGSTDSTSNLLKELNFGFCSTLNLTNDGSGLVSALNLGIKEASNDWIARFDIDDQYVLGRLNAQSELIDEKTVLVFSDYSVEGNGKVHLGTIPSAVFDLPMKLSLFSSQRTAHPVALMRRETAQAAGGYFLNDFPAEDLGLWRRMANLGEIKSVPRTLLKYNLRLESISGSRYSEIKNFTPTVIERYPINFERAVFNYRQIKNTLNLYRGLDRSNERKCLFLVDLFRLGVRDKTFKIGLLRVFYIIVSHIIRPKIISAIFKLLIDQRNRKLYRRSRPV